MNIFKNYINTIESVIKTGQIEFPEKLSNGQTIQMSPISLLIDGVTYFSLITNQSDGSKYYICKIDNAGNYDSLFLYSTTGDAYRGHLRTTFTQEGNNLIATCQTSHNGSFRIYSIDLLSFTSSFVYFKFADVGYSSILNTGQHYAIYGRSLDERNLVCYKTDNKNLSSWTTIKITNGDLPDWIYPHMPRNNEYNGEWYFEAYKRYGPDVNYYDKYLLITSDFVTWRNIDSTFSKDVTGSPITMSEFNNFRTFGNGDNTVNYRVSRSLVYEGSVYGAIYNNNETKIYKVSPGEINTYPVQITDLRLPDNYLNNGYPIISDMFIVDDTCYYIANVGQDSNYRQEFWKSDLEFQGFAKIGDLDGVINHAPYNATGGEFYIVGDLTESYPDYDPIIYNKVRI